MSKFCEIVFCVPLLFRRHVCLSNLKHPPSRELPLTARKTVFSHLKRDVKYWLDHILNSRENRKRGTLRAKETKQGRSYLYARFARAYPKTLRKKIE